LSLKLLSLYSKLSKGYALRPKASLKRCLGPKSRDLYYKLPKGGTLYIKVPPPLCDNFLEASKTKTNTVIYNQGLNLDLNLMLKGYVRDITPPYSNEFYELMGCPMTIKK
jgi:hypothetical protein